LAANGVPRFTDNQIFDVTATATEAGAPSTITKTGNQIPLPVVHVHGIMTDCLPDRVPHGLFNYLQGVHPSYTEDDGFPILTQTYPTLVSFDYRSLSGDAVDSASQTDELDTESVAADDLRKQSQRRGSQLRWNCEQSGD
jgi:hypothetical protein